MFTTPEGMFLTQRRFPKMALIRPRIDGNTLTLETREVWYTPAYYMGAWQAKLAARDAQRLEEPAAPAPAKPKPPAATPPEDSAPSFDVQLPGKQLDFGF